MSSYKLSVPHHLGILKQRTGESDCETKNTALSRSLLLGKLLAKEPPLGNVVS